MDEALENIKEVVELYLEELPEIRKEIKGIKTIGAVSVEIARQRGDHVILRRFVKGEKIVTVVPLHKEVKTGTLLGALELARIKMEDFLSKL